MTTTRDGFGVRFVAFCAAVFATVMGVLYFPPVPDELVRRPLLPGQVNAVIFIENIGPIWTVLFWVTAAAMFFAAFTGRHYIRGYLLGTFTWAMYGGAILFSAISTVPPVPVTTGVMAVGVAWGCIANARAAAERGAS